jgi:hypothetical protein
MLPWNPTAANQETDAQYLADSQRAGGATDPSVFESVLANKAFFQWSTYLTALFQAFANKGFTTSDSNLSTLTAQCSNFLTTADTKPSQVNVAYSPTPVFNGGAAQSIRFDMSGDVTSSTLVNMPPAGTLLTFFIVSPNPGAFSFAWPSNVVNARNVKTESDGNLFTQQFISDGSNFYAVETFLAVLNGLVNTAQSSANTALAEIAGLTTRSALTTNSNGNYYTWSDGLKEAWGSVSIPPTNTGGTTGTFSFSFPVAFSSNPALTINTIGAASTGDANTPPAVEIQSISTTGATIFIGKVVVASAGGGNLNTTMTLSWQAKGV